MTMPRESPALAKNMVLPCWYTATTVLPLRLQSKLVYLSSFYWTLRKLRTMAFFIHLSFSSTELCFYCAMLASSYSWDPYGPALKLLTISEACFYRSSFRFSVSYCFGMCCWINWETKCPFVPWPSATEQNQSHLRGLALISVFVTKALVSAVILETKTES